MQCNVSNCVTIWRLGAWDIVELPLLVTSSKMETAPMAGKTWQPSHGPPCPQEARHPLHWKEWKIEGWGKEGEKPLNAPHTMLLLLATLLHKLYHPKHMESDACTSIPKPQTTIGLSRSLVVTSVSLYLTSYKVISKRWPSNPMTQTIQHHAPTSWNRGFFIKIVKTIYRKL